MTPAVPHTTAIFGVLLSVCFLSVPAPSEAQSGQVMPPLVSTFITSRSVESDRANGFTSAEPKEVQKLIALFQHSESLKRDALTVVSTRDRASILLTFTDTKTKAVAGSHAFSWSSTATEYTVSADLTAGDFTKTFTGVAKDLDGSLVNLAKQVEAFVRANREKLLSLKIK